MLPMTDPDIEFWCFLSRGFIQQHNRDRGMIYSVKYLRLAHYPDFGQPDDSYVQFIPNPDFRGPISLFQSSITSQYRLEYNLELARLAYYPNLPSRLSAIYVFDDISEAQKAEARYRWSDYSDLVKLRPVNPHILCNYSRHDMEFVSRARGANLIAEDLDYMTKSYWTGKACEGMIYHGTQVKLDPIWEILYDGALTFVD